MTAPVPPALPKRRPIGLAALRGFDAAARHLSFTTAAAELNLTQSSISRQIAALEQQVGKALFVRKTRALLLTPAGAQLQQAVLQALQAVDRSVDAIRGVGELQRVTLSTYASFASLWLVPRLALFQRDHPGIEIRLDASDRVVDLDAEDVDIAIRWIPRHKLPANATLLIDDELAPAISPRLLQGRRLRKPAELVQWPLLDLDDAVPGAQRLNWATWFDFAGAGSVRPAAGRLVFSFVDQAVQAAVRGQGVALVRSPFLQDVLASGDLVMPFPQLRMPGGYRHVLVLSRQVGRRPHVQAFVAWLNEQIAQAPRLD
ncbi:MAG TPA: LysR substrate-binding domain-containing protein [Rubrivivax sp.]|nr:LysR substrate-binding domain-containing protein [Rubrivivax sp.]